MKFVLNSSLLLLYVVTVSLISFSIVVGTTAPPLWEQPSLPTVQLQPASMSTVPVQVLPTQVLQVSYV